MADPDSQERPSWLRLWHPDTPRVERWIRSAVVVGLAGFACLRGGEPAAVPVIGGTVYVILRLMPPDIGRWLRQEPASGPPTRPASPMRAEVPYEEAPLQTWLCAPDLDAETVAARLGLSGGSSASFREGVRAATEPDSDLVFMVGHAGGCAVFGGQIGLSDWHERVTLPQGEAFCAFLDERQNNVVLAYAVDGVEVRALSGDPDTGLTERGAPRPGEPRLDEDARYAIEPWWEVVRAWGGLTPASLAADAPEGILYRRVHSGS